LLPKKLICSFNYDNQYVKLQGQQINIGEEGITKVLNLSYEGLMARAQEGCNGVIATYFANTQQEHYLLKSRYVLAQANGKARVRKLEALIKILTFCQGNQFSLGSLVFVILATKKEPVN